MLLEVMPNTALPAMAINTVLVVGILLAYLVIDLLELKPLGRPFGQYFVQGGVIGVIRLLEFLLCALLLGFHG
jgi:hypothetical protein